MSNSERVDVAVIGAGPAGSCAALRLLKMNRSVALIERMEFPRPQIGESLSPGIWNILDYLDARDVITGDASLRDLPALVAWESSIADLVPRGGGGLMVDRGEFDSRLLQLASIRGARVLQPAWPVDIDGAPDAWDLRIESNGRQIDLRARFIIDARGRTGVTGRHYISLAPPTIAVWTHVNGNAMPLEIRVETIDRGWMWGAPLLNGHYRVMAFLDASVLKQDRKLADHLRSCLANAHLFRDAVEEPFLSPVATCSTSSFLDLDFAEVNRFKVGESALALDPLSSSGVEKSMRMALQGAIAANTILSDRSKTAIAIEFIESRVIDSAVTHFHWSRGYHRQLLHRFDHKFWQERAAYTPEPTQVSSHVADRFFQACGRSSARRLKNSLATQQQSLKAPEALSLMLNQWETSVSLSPALTFVPSVCVIDDHVELRQAILHPSLSEPVAFLGEQQLAPLLRDVSITGNLGQLLGIWESKMGRRTAMQIAAWLDHRHILQLQPVSLTRPPSSSVR